MDLFWTVSWNLDCHWHPPLPRQVQWQSARVNDMNLVDDGVTFVVTAIMSVLLVLVTLLVMVIAMVMSMA